MKRWRLNSTRTVNSARKTRVSSVPVRVLRYQGIKGKLLKKVIEGYKAVRRATMVRDEKKPRRSQSNN